MTPLVIVSQIIADVDSKSRRRWINGLYMYAADTTVTACAKPSVVFSSGKGPRRIDGMKTIRVRVWRTVTNRRLLVYPKRNDVFLLYIVPWEQPQVRISSFVGRKALSNWRFDNRKRYYDGSKYFIGRRGRCNNILFKYIIN